VVGRLNIYDSRFNYNYKGFTSIVNQLIALAKIHYERFGNYNVFVEDEQVLDLFDNNYKVNNDDNIYDVHPIFFEEFYKGKYEHDFNAHKLVDVGDLKTRDPKNFMSLKKEHLNQFNKLKSELFMGENILGVQIRGTDKKTELPKIEESIVINHIDKLLNNNTEIDRIFVSTDDFNYLDIILKTFGDKNVIYNDKNLISRDGEPLHTRYDRKKINYEVMSDVYLLSKCNHMLYSFSNVSFLALSMMENFNKQLININT
jgi:hypothetical protein